MNVLNQQQGFIFLLIFGLVMLVLTWVLSNKNKWINTKSGFLKASSNVNYFVGSFSISASWLWAPALFVSVQKSYELGLPGLFWFTFPNIIALLLFAFLGPKIREKIPGGYTFPDWIRYRFSDNKIHKIYFLIFLWYQIMAITIQIFVGGILISFFTGIHLNYVMVSLLMIGLSYSLLSGLRASIITDLLQMIMILGVGILIIPWTISASGGLETVYKGIGGLAHKTNIFDWDVFYSFGIVSSIGLIAGAISDQQYWQRSFAIKKTHIVKSFVLGGLLFGLVPIGLSVLGFIGANPELEIQNLQGTDLPMIGVAVVSKLLPAWASILFIVMLLSGLSSTLDSGFAAGASLWAIDGFSLDSEEKKVLDKERLELELTKEEEKIKLKLDLKIPKLARYAMIGLALAGLGVAFAVEYIPNFGLDKLWWVFNAIASMTVVPTVLSLYWDKLSSKGVLYGFIGSFIGIGSFIWGNAIGNIDLIIFSAIFIVLISIVMNLAFPRKERFLVN